MNASGTRREMKCEMSCKVRWFQLPDEWRGPRNDGLLEVWTGADQNREQRTALRRIHGSYMSIVEGG
jgi:hypothetical protein